MRPTGVAILGSTGSIGRQTLDVIRSLPDRFRVVALSAGRNVTMLEEQAREAGRAGIDHPSPAAEAQMTKLTRRGVGRPAD